MNTYTTTAAAGASIGDVLDAGRKFIESAPPPPGSGECCNCHRGLTERTRTGVYSGSPIFGPLVGYVCPACKELLKVVVSRCCRR